MDCSTFFLRATFPASHISLYVIKQSVDTLRNLGNIPFVILNRSPAFADQFAKLLLTETPVLSQFFDPAAFDCSMIA